jgi:GNAT superfamily N-acetyltransferase
MTAMAEPISIEQRVIVPANQASWDDIESVFGASDYPFLCQCQRFKVAGWIWRDSTLQRRLAMHRAGTACGDPAAEHSSGLVAYLQGEPVAWVAVEPRTAYPGLHGSRVVWPGRSEDKDDDTVWSVTCFCVRKGYRGRGVTYPLAQAAADHARERGATAVEGYPMVTRPGMVITWGEIHVGAVQVFEEAGFTEVSAPTKRRRVMRIDFE